MNQRLEVALTVLIAAAALSTAAVVVHREFSGTPPAAMARPEKPTYLSSWKDLLSAGHFVGVPSAPVTVIEFADVECPFCRMFNASFDSVKTQMGDSLALVFVHFPIQSHRFALPGARALECAGNGSHFGDLVSLLYSKQDSLGLKSWPSFAHDAGIADTVAFGRCVQETSPIKAADAGTALGRKLGVRGTPTVYINGWKFSAAMSAADLHQIIEDVRTGKEPMAIGSR
jgi:protein-disulfide isomerase